MISNDTLLTIIVCVFVILVFAIKIIVSITCFNKETECIRNEIQRLYEDDEYDEYDEYKYWRRELRCHYLCLIPFVNKKNVMWLYDRIYHKKNEIETSIYRIIGPSLIGVCICIICLCSVSWAWFDASRYSSVDSIKSATYTGKITVIKDGNTLDIPQNHSIKKCSNIYEIILESGSNYEIKIEANGTGTTGYYKIKLDDDFYYTPQVSKGCYFKFKIDSNKNGKVSITPQWGTCTSSDEKINKDIPLIYGNDIENDANKTKNNSQITTNNKNTKDNKNNTIVIDNNEPTGNTDESDSSKDNKNNTNGDIVNNKYTNNNVNNTNAGNEEDSVDDNKPGEDESSDLGVEGETSDNEMTP